MMKSFIIRTGRWQKQARYRGEHGVYKEILTAFLHRTARNRMWKRFFQSFPVENEKIVFNNFNGKGFGDNPKYIALELLRRKKPRDLVWLVSQKDAEMPPTIRQVHIGSKRAMYELATAHIIVNNVKNGLPYYKREEQFYIQTWHGEHGFKDIEKQVEKQLNPSYVASSKEDSKNIDLFLSGGAYSDDWIRDTFWYDGKILTCGFPRNDLFFRADEATVQRIRSRLGIPPNAKCLMYAPTFRDSETYNPYDLDVQAALSAATKRFGGKWIALIRLHPNDAKKSTLFSYDDVVKNASYYPDMQELLLVSDLLITDYSSCEGDMIFCLHRPTFFYTSDLERYVSESRTLSQIFFDIPYPKCKTNEELVNAIQAYDPVEYEKMEEIYRRMEPDVNDGHASETVVDVMERLMESGL